MHIRFALRLSPGATEDGGTNRGQALVEYALILLLIAVVAVGALQLIGTNVTSALNSIAGL